MKAKTTKVSIARKLELHRLEAFEKAIAAVLAKAKQQQILFLKKRHKHKFKAPTAFIRLHVTGNGPSSTAVKYIFIAIED